jgi:hypothetical protein
VQPRYSCSFCVLCAAQACAAGSAPGVSSGYPRRAEPHTPWFSRQAPFRLLRGRLFLRRKSLFVGHDTQVLDKAQDTLQIQAVGALAALHMPDLAAPLRPACSPLAPEADDERTGRWCCEWTSHLYRGCQIQAANGRHVQPGQSRIRRYRAGARSRRLVAAGSTALAGSQPEALRPSGLLPTPAAAFGLPPSLRQPRGECLQCFCSSAWRLSDRT